MNLYLSFIKIKKIKGIKDPPLQQQQECKILQATVNLNQSMNLMATHGIKVFSNTILIDTSQPRSALTFHITFWMLLATHE